jgi:hypothetical protein
LAECKTPLPRIDSFSFIESREQLHHPDAE